MQKDKTFLFQLWKIKNEWSWTAGGSLPISNTGHRLLPSLSLPTSPAGFHIKCGAAGCECSCAERCVPWATQAVCSIFSVFFTSEIWVFLWKHNQVSELDGISCKSSVLFLPARFGNRVFLCAPACLLRMCQALDESITLRYTFYSKPNVCLLLWRLRWALFSFVERNQINSPNCPVEQEDELLFRN